jgi:hypothetical protein
MGTTKTGLRPARRIDASLVAKKLNKPEEQVQERALTLAPKEAKQKPQPSRRKVEITPPAEKELMGWVEKLGRKKLLDMPQLLARKAYDCLAQHQDSFDYVPGASRLYERLKQQYA